MKTLFMVTAKSSPEGFQGSAGLNKELSLYGRRRFVKTEKRRKTKGTVEIRRISTVCR